MRYQLNNKIPDVPRVVIEKVNRRGIDQRCLRILRKCKIKYAVVKIKYDT